MWCHCLLAIDLNASNYHKSQTDKPVILRLILVSISISDLLLSPFKHILYINLNVGLGVLVEL